MALALLALLASGAVLTSTAQTLASARTATRWQTPAVQPAATVELRRLLADLEQAYGVRFNYRLQVVRDVKVAPTSLRDFGPRLADKLNDLLAPAGLQCKALDERTFVIQQKPTPAVPESRAPRFPESPPSAPEPAVTEAVVAIAVSGRVTASETGEALPGVNVAVKGTTQGTSTDATGTYRIAVPDGSAVLVFSSVGYQKQEITVGTQTTINVALKADVQGLGEVVVVGYGTQNRRDLTTAVGTVKGTELNSIPTASPGQALVGKLAGITLQQATGAPGAPPVIRIRGNGSITNGNSPLFVIDGYPTNDAQLFNNIPPTEIESIDVLKDAASAAIYGSRAGNGVVIVTTKRGKSGKTRFSLDVVQGAETITKKYPVLNAAQYLDLQRDFYAYRNQPLPTFLQNPANLVETDWQDQIFRTAPFQNYQLGATGGTDRIQYAITGGYLRQDGVIHRSGLERYNFRLNLDANLTDRLKVGTSLQPTFTIRQDQDPSGPNNPGNTRGLIAKALTMPPIFPVYTANGDYFHPIQSLDPATAAFFNTQLFNPVNNIDAFTASSRAARLQGNAYAELEILPDLRARSTFNLGITNDRYETYRAAFVAFQGNPNGNLSRPNFSAIDALRQNGTFTNWYWSNTLTYRKTFAQKHSLSALLGYDAAKQADYLTQVTPRTDQNNPVAFTNDLVKNVQGAVLTQGFSSNQFYAFDAVFGRLEYSYGGKYYLTGSLRRDRSTRFGPNNRAGVFPSVSGAWRVAEEPFLKSFGWVSDLKLRASYGETGNDQLPGGYYPWVGSVGSTFYSFGGATDARVLGYRLNGFTNSELAWEKNKQTDVGLDFGFLNNRLLLTADYYVRNSNAILSAPIPSINGIAGSVLQNVGNIRNKGFELTLDAVILPGQNNGLRWNLNVNLSRNRNEITRLAPGQTQLPNQFGGEIGGDWGQVVRNLVGRPMGDMYLYEVVGTFNNQEQLNTLPKLGAQNIGDLRFRDVNGDGTININDMTFVGNYQANFTYGLTNSLAYKGFDLSFVLQGVQGGKIVNALERGLSLHRNLENAGTTALNRWRSEQDPGDGLNQRAGSLTLGSNIGPNARYLYDASFLRLRNVTLAYTLPAALVRRAFLQSARVYVTGQNLLTLTKYVGYNPEPNLYGDNATQNGIDMGTYPVTRNLSFGLNLGF